MERVAALYRLSSAKQVKAQRRDNVDIPGQKSAVAHFVQDHEDWQLVKEYTEPGVSAYKKRWQERPQLLQAFDDARNGLFDILCVFREDRLSRGDEEDGSEMIVVLSMFKASGVQVWSVADNKLLDLKGAQLIMRASEAYASNQESQKTSQRVKNGMKTAAEGGRWMGGRVPFGYRLDAEIDANGQPAVRGGRAVRKLVPHEDHAPIVREIFSRYLSGQGTTQLAAWLNSSGVPSYTGKGWEAMGVMHLLSNPLRTGTVAYHKSWRSRKHGEDSFVAQGTHAPIIDKETFERAQSVREARRRIPSRQLGATYALGGVAYCKCGARLGGITRTRMNKSGLMAYAPKYRCREWIGRGVCSAGVRQLDAEVVEQNFITAIEQLQHRTPLRKLIEKRFTANDTRRADAIQTRKGQQEELQRVNQALSKLAKGFLESDLYTPDEYKRLKADYIERREQLEAQVSEALPVDQQMDTGELEQIARDIRDLWMSDGSPKERQAYAMNITHAWGLRVVVDKDATVSFEVAPSL